MNVQRLRPGEWIALFGAVALLASMFVEWYSHAPNEASAANAWRAFTVTDVVLLVVAIAAILLAVLQATRRAPALPVAAGVLTTLVGMAGTLLVTARIVNTPGPNFDIELEAGAWVGLAAVAAIAVGGWLSIRDEHTRAEAAPEVPVRPAPGM
jgi:hypothetical protein